MAGIGKGSTRATERRHGPGFANEHFEAEPMNLIRLEQISYLGKVVSHLALPNGMSLSKWRLIVAHVQILAT